MALILSFFVLLGSALAEEPKNRQILPICESSKIDELKSKLSETLTQIFCLRAEGITDSALCTAKAFAGVVSAGSVAAALSTKSALTKHSQLTDQVKQLKAEKLPLDAELAKQKEFGEKLRQAIENADRSINEAIIKRDAKGLNEAKKELGKNLIEKNKNEAQIETREKIVRAQDARIAKETAKLSRIDAENLSREIGRAKAIAKIGGAAALGVNILEIGPDCRLRGSVSTDENCVPIPILGREDMETLYGERLHELAKSLPQLCPHVENLNKVMATRLEELKKMYSEGITYSHPKCEGGRISYNVNGNGYVKNGEVTLEVTSDGTIKNSLVTAGNLIYKTDYATGAGGQLVVNSLSWESTDPKFPGTQVTQREILSAMKQEVVERGVSFHILNKTRGPAAIACCNNVSSCEGFLPIPSGQQLKGVAPAAH